MTTRRLSIALTLVALAFAREAGAGESKKPVTKWTCFDFVGFDDQFKPKAVYWATAYSKGGKPEAAVVDIAGTEKVIPIIVDECQKDPQASFWQKLKSTWSKVEADAKADLKKIESKM